MLRRSPIVLVLLAGIACSSVEPKPGTVLVHNATCVPGPCASVEVLVYPSSQPRTPGGMWSISLGTVTGPSACLTFPASATFRVNGTVTNSWTPGDSAELGGLLPEDSRIQSSPTTAEFVPASETGWSVTLPGDTLAHPGQACSP